VDAVAADNSTVHIDTLLDALNNYVKVRQVIGMAGGWIDRGA